MSLALFLVTVNSAEKISQLIDKRARSISWSPKTFKGKQLGGQRKVQFNPALMTEFVHRMTDKRAHLFSHPPTEELIH